MGKNIKGMIATILSLVIFGCGSDNNKPAQEKQEPPQNSEMTAAEIREFIGSQVGGLDKLKVPEKNADIPVPLLEDGTANPKFITTEAKRFLGKLLFHDPVRTVRIDPEFGGIPETARTGSCASCHIGRSGSKAGMQFNFNVGGEGLGYTDAEGNFTPRRRARMDILPQLRQEPLFIGDLMVDDLPTLTDVYENTIDIPAVARKEPSPGALLKTGRLDALDSVSRNAPSVLGAAFNNRLLLGGFAGEPDDAVRGLNPFNHPAQENIALLLLDAHRMLEAQAAEIQKFPAYHKLFKDAFPEEAEAFETSGDLNDLINDLTVLRATATFMRTVVTRNSPWDKFLAGDDNALSESQLNGAKLFFTDATDNQGGAACYVCHSGPMLNKQHNDPDVAGIGEFIEENFHNLGLEDHPLQALNREVRNDPEFRDRGREEITLKEEDAFKFRTLTLRQLRDSGAFFHNGAFGSIKQVIEYFNNGIPQDAVAGNAETISPHFTHPRGEGAESGLGLSDKEVSDLTAFIADGLFDSAFVDFDSDSTTDTFALNIKDITYSEHYPELAALGAQDGLLPSGLPQGNNDPLSRRDMGIDPPIDVTEKLTVALDKQAFAEPSIQDDTFLVTNSSEQVIDTHLIVVIHDLPDDIEALETSGVTANNEPYYRIHLDNGVIESKVSVFCDFKFKNKQGNAITEPINYRLQFLSGQGNP